MSRDSLHDLTARIRRWIALEELLFETLGSWALAVPEAPVKRVLATWCHRHAWHAELWRARLPVIPGRTEANDTPDHARHADDVAGWIEPLSRVLTDPGIAATTSDKLAILADPVLAAMRSALDEHGAAIDARLDGPTARVLQLVGADLANELAAINRARDHDLSRSRVAARGAGATPIG